MSETWDRTRRRYRLSEEVLRDVDRRGLPALAGWQERIEAEYDDDGGLGGFLRDLQARWRRTFDARLDAVLEDESAELDRAVPRLWAALASELSSTRRILDEYADHPTPAALQARHRRQLLALTGVDIADLQDRSSTRPDQGETHGREHRPHRAPARRLRLRPLCPRLHRRPVSAADAAARVRSGA